jgi:hypothetical protein
MESQQPLPVNLPLEYSNSTYAAADSLALLSGGPTANQLTPFRFDSQSAGTTACQPQLCRSAQKQNDDTYHDNEDSGIGISDEELEDHHADMPNVSEPHYSTYPGGYPSQQRVPSIQSILSEAFRFATSGSPIEVGVNFVSEHGILYPSEHEDGPETSYISPDLSTDSGYGSIEFPGESTDSGYGSIEFPGEHEDGPKTSILSANFRSIDSGYGSIVSPRFQPLQLAFSRQQNSKCSRKSICLADLNDHDRTRSAPACSLCGRTFSSRSSLRRHTLSKTACLGRRSQSHTSRHVDKVASKTERPLPPTTERKTFRHNRQAVATTGIELPSTHPLVPPLPGRTLPLISNLIHLVSSGGAENGEESDLSCSTLGVLEDASSHCANAKVGTAESEFIPFEGPTSLESIVTEQLELDDLWRNAQPSPRNTEESPEQQVDSTNSSNAIVPTYLTGNDMASKLAQEEKTEQPGYVKNWVDSTYAIQSPPSGYSGDGITSRASDFGIGHETTQAMSESEGDRIDTDSESFVWTEYSENSPEWDPSGAILAPMKLEYIERLLFSFSLVRRQWQSPAASDQEGSDRSTGSRSGKRQASSPPSSNSFETRSPKRTKRQSTNGGDGDGQGGDDDGNDSHNTPPKIAEDGQETCLLFACPFVKRYQHRYHKCYSYILKDVARVKYHLFRDKVHRLPIYCPKCSETFSKEDIRDEHVRAAKCTKKPQVKWEGITAGQREQLNKRSPSTNSAVENWNAVYRILFPGDPLPNSPHIDIPLSGELRAFREHILSEGPPVWNEILRTRLPENLRPFLEELQLFHRSFYSETVTRLFERWNSSHSTTCSLQLQPSSSPIRQETELLVDSTSTAAVGGSNSPSGSDSALGRSVTDGSQSKTEPSPASQNGVPTVHTQQQQSTMQRGPQAVFLPQQSQTAPGVPHSTPQTPFFIPTQNTDVPLTAQYPFGFGGQTEYGLPHILYQPPQVSTFTPSLGQSLYVQYGLSSPQPDPEIRQFQYQLPSVDFPQGGSYQPHQMQIQPQLSYHMPTPLPPASIPMGGKWAPPEAELPRI